MGAVDIFGSAFGDRDLTPQVAAEGLAKLFNFLGAPAGQDDFQSTLTPQTQTTTFTETPPTAIPVAEQPIQGVVMPAPGGTSNEAGQQYGAPRDHGPHGGVDFGVPSGTPILAALPGEVIFAGNAGDAGNMVTIQHANGLITKYMHLTNASVSPGDTVTAGQEIGASGSTGASTGPHLHFQVEQDGNTIDPIPFLASGIQIAAPDKTPGQTVTTKTEESEEGRIVRGAANLIAFLGGEPGTPEPTPTSTTTTVPGEAGPGAETPEVEGDLETWIRWAMAVKGVDESWFEGLYHRAMVESNGQNIQQHASTRDINSGGNEAFGPWQFVQGTFNNFAEPGYEDWHNPYHQALAIINAVMRSDKYGGHPSGLPRSGGWSP
jgi:hypothetical protein